MYKLVNFVIMLFLVPFALSCGDGIIESGEECDDGNTLSGDGCDASCIVEEECYDVGNTFSFIVMSDTYGGVQGGPRRVLQRVYDQSIYPDRNSFCVP